MRQAMLVAERKNRDLHFLCFGFLAQVVMINLTGVMIFYGTINL